MPTGKGERLVLLTAITEEHGILKSKVPGLSTILIFQARKPTGDYHKNMNADCFCEWLEQQLFPVMAENGLEGLLVMDNAAYHTTPAAHSINPLSFTKKKDVTDIMDQHGISYRPGRAPAGDSLKELQGKLQSWLELHGEDKGLSYNLTRVQHLCATHGHPPPVLTPPYHPELQPIEQLWRDAKMYTARNFAGTRDMKTLEEHIRAGFALYGTPEHSARKVARARKEERKYIEEGVYAPVVDLASFLVDPEDEDEVVSEEEEEQSD